MNRRDFLKTGALGALTLMGAGGLMETISASPREVKLPQGRKIDIHAHAMLPSYIEGLKELGIDAAVEEGYPLPQWSEEAHLASWQRRGLTTRCCPWLPHIFIMGMKG